MVCGVFIPLLGQLAVGTEIPCVAQAYERSEDPLYALECLGLCRGQSAEWAGGVRFGGCVE